MYKSILVPVDNSEHSEYAETLAVSIASRCDASVTGFHSYSGRFHQFRFRVLESHLPEKYQKEDILEYQRKIHSVLIERGLEIISLQYMTRLREKCRNHGITFQEKIIDGKNSDNILNEAKHHDLVVMGSQGLTRVDGVRMGSNTRRVLRHGTIDMLIARRETQLRRIFVGIDGSEYSYQVLKKALEIAKLFEAEITVITSFDSALHHSVFTSLTDVLSEEAGKVFKFKEQEDLHTLVIDQSLEDLYKGYLEKGKALSTDYNSKVETELLRGNPYDAVCKKVNEENPDLIIVGRHGMHRGYHEKIGSNAERIAELADTNVLVITTGEPVREQEVPTEAQPVVSGAEKVEWTKEAQERLERIPSFARPMAVLAIERYAKEKGYTVITPEVMSKARNAYES